jgi:N-acetylneuraminic acid mutarotase
VAGALLETAQAGVFVPTGSLHEPRDDHTATLLANGKVLVAGGSGTNGLTLASAELYDAVTGEWIPTGALNTPRFYHKATLLTNGKVLVVGGGNGSVRSLAGAELYDPATGTWTVTGPLNTGREGHTATLLLNGKVLVAGGERYDLTRYFSVGSTELYDPATGIWTLSGSLNEPHEWHTATLLPNGKVLVAGGFNDDSPWPQLDSAELYDPASGTWTLTGPLTDRRSSHTATLLPNGKVLVAGGGTWGFFANVLPLESAELYDPGNGT